MMPYDEGGQPYLENEVLSASPQKLRLLLIEAALRRARLAVEHLVESRPTDAILAGQRCQEILCELLAGVKPDAGDVARRTRDLYLFLLKAANEALARHDPAAWSPVVELLEMERETWQLVCQQLSGAETPGTPPSPPVGLGPAWTSGNTGSMAWSMNSVTPGGCWEA
ncbi:MAG: hypothetical protein KatS3mg110_2846 [Pirellulaceae bacterium]|nr:MAG: hypothetical protein KatS3mg110_2846 [Pirellulaceae bacterium]